LKSAAIKKLKKLRGRSLDELRVRGSQSLSALAERRGFSAQTRVPTDAAFFKQIDLDGWRSKGSRRRPRSADELLAHFRARTTPRFFASFDDRANVAAAWRELFKGDYEKSLVEHAEKIVAGRFDLLGLRDLSFGNEIDWHLEPVNDKRAPLAHWSRIDYLNAEVAGDKKITWELNRQQHFMTLGRAYLATRDERYAETFAAHLSSWMDANPPKQGINWASSLEVSFRAISWLWALNFFRDSPLLAPQLFARALKFLHIHARHLETYLSIYFSPNTHLTGEALGLFYLGTLLPELRDAARWRETGRRVLVAQLARHVRADGTYFEQSSYYQRYTADFYTHFLLLARANSAPVEKYVEQKLIALLDHLMHVTRPDGTTPLYGDDDGGRLARLEEGRGADDFRATLSNGAALFARPDYKFVARALSEETFWLTGRAGVKQFAALDAAPPAQDSRAFTDGGYYAMRDGWSSDSNFMLLDCGEHGADNCGHAHADALSFDLTARGRSVLVDPGTYTYTGSSDLRDHFRSTAAHNTLVIDGQSSSLPGGAFQWKHVARSTARRWIGGARFDHFDGAHDGYARLYAPARHARSILFLKGDYWIVRDAVETEGTHDYESFFHFAHGVEPSISTDANGARTVRAWSAGGELLVELFAPGDADSWRVADDWVSRCYARKESALTCVRSRRGDGRQEFYTFVVPHPSPATGADAARSSRSGVIAADGEIEITAREIKAAGGRAFELRRGDVRDLLLVGSGLGASVAAGSVVSDFEWAWLRFIGDETAPREIVLVAGSRLVVGDAEVLRGGEYVEHLSARRVGGKWRIVDQEGGRGVCLTEMAGVIARAGELEDEAEREVVGQG
jgi:hypothetical protein